MIQLMLPEGDESSDFAGPARLSVGFMQSILELLTAPGDIVMDWTVGVGSTFWAGDFSGRFVIGMENREQFVKVAARTLDEVHKRSKEVQKEKSIVVAQANPADDPDDDDLFNFGAGPNTPGSSSHTATLGRDE